MSAEIHLVTIDPPTKQRPTWMTKCSMGDFSQSYLNRVEAHIFATKHYTDLMLKDSLERGIYEFDDGR
jgi:hypothetical protein